MTKLLVVRPQPGADESVARASALGLAAVAAPLFTVAALPWHAPRPDDFDALLMTSANAARHGGLALRSFAFLPCYAVGEATAAAARDAGFDRVTRGEKDGDAALALAEDEGRRHVLHLCGRDHKAIERSGLSVTRCQVYAVEALDALPAAALDALRDEAVVLLHSPRAAAHFAKLVDEAGLDRSETRLITISAAAARAAGEGWHAKHIAPIPRDEALLELAAKLCKTGSMSDGTGR